MESTAVKFKTVEEYLSSLPADKKRLVKEMRKTIKAAAPEAEELISYNMPALRFHGMLVYYAAWKEHIGFYGVSASIVNVFKKELAPYKISRGTVQFPLDEPLPVDLITKIVRHRVQENLQKAATKKGGGKQGDRP